MIPRHEARLHVDLDRIRALVADLCRAVRSALEESVRALLRQDRDRMHRVALGDLAINRDSRALDAEVHRFIACHIPATGHLRFALSVLRLTVSLERIGDYAVTICRVGTHLDKPLPATVENEIRTLADVAIDTFGQATRAFLTSDAGLARRTMDLAEGVDVVHDRMDPRSADSGCDRSVRDRVGAITVIRQLERVAEQARTVCELTVFATTGQPDADPVA